MQKFQTELGDYRTIILLANRVCQLPIIIMQQIIKNKKQKSHKCCNSKSKMLQLCKLVYHQITMASTQ